MKTHVLASQGHWGGMEEPVAIQEDVHQSLLTWTDLGMPVTTSRC